MATEILFITPKYISQKKIKTVDHFAMEDLSDYTSPVVEFKPTHIVDRQLKSIDNSTATDPLPAKLDSSTETCNRFSQTTQTTNFNANITNVDERKLASWLRYIFPQVEKELLKGCTPHFNNYSTSQTTTDYHIQLYQKLTLPTVENCQCLATWLAVHTNNAPALVVSTIAPHDDWCEHVDQSLQVYVPKRDQNAVFISFREVKSVPIKACLRSLCTNAFNKNMFSGSTMDGDVYIWYCEQNFNKIDIKELHQTTSPHGFAVAMDWSNEQTLLTAHNNGNVIQWHIGENDLIKEAEYFIKPPTSSQSPEICCFLALSSRDFVVGCNDGSMYHCWISSATTMKRHLEVIPLKQHRFMCSSLLRIKQNCHTQVMSCDLSGEVYLHDLRNNDDDADTLIAQIPLPFKNVIACTQDGSLIYSPAEDGSLDCFSLQEGFHFTIKGVLRGKGNFIKTSDNGCWIVTGLYENEMQIYCVGN